MLQEFGPGIWQAEGPPVDGALGFRFPTRMVVIRLASGGLFLWSPVAPSPDLARAVTALGPVLHLVGPNHLHHLHLGDWAAAFPQARLHGTAALAKKRPDLRFHSVLGEAPPPDWAVEIDQILLRGNKVTDEAVFFHRESRTAIFTDLLQQFAPDWFSGWRGTVARLDLTTGDAPAIPRLYRLGFTDRAAAQASLAPVLDWRAERLLAAHAPPVKQGADALLRRALKGYC